MKITIEELPFGNVPVAQAMVNRMIDLGADKHPVLVDLRRDVFRGGRVWVAYRDEVPVALNCSRIGKRNSNIWEPYVAWWGNYTMPNERNKGHSTALWKRVEKVALAAGCKRVNSLAGSAAAVGLYNKLMFHLWGKTENGEVYMDSPLQGFEGHYRWADSPPKAPHPQRLTQREIKAIIKEGLKYDHAT